MTERTYTREELMQAAEEVEGISIQGLQNLLDYIDAKDRRAQALAAQMAQAKRSKPPVPEDYRKVAIDASGYNIGPYTFIGGDKHYWLPPEEARKERPDVSKGILHTDTLFAE
jgi:hypothetical protein